MKLPHPRQRLESKLLILFIVITSIPLLFANILWFNSSRNQIINSSSDNLATATIDLQRLIENYLSEKRISLIIHSQSADILGLDIPDATQTIQQSLYQDQDIQQIDLMDHNGQEIIKVDRTRIFPKEELVNASDSASFKIPTFAGGNEYISPVYTLGSSHLVDISIPIVKLDNTQELSGITTSSIGKARKPGEIMGVLKESITLDGLFKQITSTNPEKDGYAFLVDDKGDLLAYPGMSNISPQTLKSTPVIKYFLSYITSTNQDNPSVNRISSERNVPSLATFAKVSPTNWGVITEVPLSSVLATTNQFGVFAIVLFISILVFVVLMSLWFSGQLVAPIQLLEEGVKLIGRGNLNYRLQINTGDEIEELSDEFNNMATSLRETILKMASQNKLFEALKDIDSVLLSNIEIEPLAQTIVDLIGERLGYVFGAIALVDKKRGTLRRLALSSSRYPQMTIALKNSVKEIVKIPYSKQEVSLDNDANLLVKAVKERKRFYTNTLADIERGIFPDETSRQLEAYLKQNGHPYSGIFIYPLVFKGEVIGIIYYASELDSSHTPEADLMIMDNFTSEVAKALANALLYEDIKEEGQVLSAERNKLAVILSGISDAVIAVDLNRNILTFNKSAEELTGYEVHQVLGKNIGEVLKIYDSKEELGVDTYCPIGKDGYEGVAFNQGHLKLTGSKNKESMVNLISGQIHEGGRVNLGCILTLHDLSKEQQLEEMKIDFVSMAAHELRTPLTSLKGYLYIFLRDYKNSLTNEQQTIINRVNIATQRIVALVENLLNVTRIERGALTIHLEEVNWIANLEEVIGEVIDQAKDKNIEFTFEKPKEKLPLLQVDKFRIDEVITNLITNAINYTKPGGKVKVWVEFKGGEIITHVTDTGEGIPTSAIPHLFTKFFRVSGKLEQGSKGTGLGLYIAKSIVEMHNGRIWVESEFGKGSTFSFALPIDQPQASTNPLLQPVIKDR